jgi:hypothetical protein
MSRITTMELKEFKRTLKVAHQRKRDMLCKLALEQLNDKESLAYSEINIQNIDKIMYKAYKNTNNKLTEDAPTVLNNVLFSFVIDSEPACFILRYKEGNKEQQVSICSIHMTTDEDGQVLVSTHYIDRSGGKSKQRVKQVIYKTEGENIFSFGDSDNFKSKIISFAYTFQMLLNQFCEDTDKEKIETDEQLSEMINEYFQGFIKDDLLRIEKSKEEMDLTNAINLLNADDDEEVLSFASNG